MMRASDAWLRHVLQSGEETRGICLKLHVAGSASAQTRKEEELKERQEKLANNFCGE